MYGITHTLTAFERLQNLECPNGGLALIRIVNSSSLVFFKLAVKLAIKLAIKPAVKLAIKLAVELAIKLAVELAIKLAVMLAATST